MRSHLDHRALHATAIEDTAMLPKVFPASTFYHTSAVMRKLLNAEVVKHWP